MNIRVFAEGITVIESCTGKELTPTQHQIYKKLLDDIPDRAFLEGVERLMKERVYTNLPSPAEIRQYCLGLKEDDMQVRITEGINSVKEAIRLAGAYKEVAFADPTLHCIVKSVGGWIKLCQMSLDDLDKWFKFDFPKLYRAYANRKTEVEMYMTGIGFSKREVPQIIYIGGMEKVQGWWQQYIERKQGLIGEKEQTKLLMLGLDYGYVGENTYGNKMIEQTVQDIKKLKEVK